MVNWTFGVSQAKLVPGAKAPNLQSRHNIWSSANNKYSQGTSTDRQNLFFERTEALLSD